MHQVDFYSFHDGSDRIDIHALAVVSVLLPQWLRRDYFALALEQVRGLEQKSLTLVNAS